MLKLKYSHVIYQKFVESYLDKFYIQTGQTITLLERSSVLKKIWSCDLTGIIHILKNSYSKSIQGIPPKDAVALFRSLILMSYAKITSISRWIKILRSDPFYAILSGFVPACISIKEATTISADIVPGVGTFYDFMDRLVDADKSFYKNKLKKVQRKPRKKQKKNQKMKTSKAGVVDRIIKRVLKYKNSKLPLKIESKLNQILKNLFVIPSLNLGILGDVSKFNIAADGTCIPTQASPYGKKVCNCKLTPGKKCDCLRKFTDPSAAWGWDSFNEKYFYGHTYHGFTASDSFYSLPIHIKFVNAKRHDSVTGVYALKELTDLYSEINFHASIYDSAYDVSSFYLFNIHHGISPIIDLNQRSSKPNSKNKYIYLDENGIPHCKTYGHKLRNWGIVKKEYRHKWLFPVQCDSCNQCPMESKKTYYTKTKDNPRYFTPILRNSPLWRKLYKTRTTTERCWNRINNDFHAEDANVYTIERRIVRVFLGAFCCYIDAWASEYKLEITDIFPQLIEKAA